MATVLDLAARVGDAMKDSEFHDHPDRFKMHLNVSELRRINWIRYHNLSGNDYQNSDHGRNLKKKDEHLYKTTLALLKKLRVPTIRA